MLIIGRNPVIEALRFNPQSIQKISILNGLTDKKIKEIIQKANAKNISIDKLKKKDFEGLFDAKDKSEGISQGIIAVANDFKYTEFIEVLDREKIKSYSTIVVLDEIQDPHNLGAIIRSCAAAGVGSILLTEKNTAKVNHTVIKTSSGATNHVNICLVKNIYEAIDELKKLHFNIVGTSLNAEVSHFDYTFNSKTVLILGNEGQGLRKNILKLCDNIVRIPILNKRIDSLNVSVAAGVILFEILRQRQK